MQPELPSETREESLLRRFWPVLLGAVGAFLTFRPFWEPDLFWHLALGKAVLAARSRVVAETIAIAGFRPDNIALEWLWEVAAYVAWSRGGWALLAVMTMALAAAVAIMLWRMIAGLTPGTRPVVHAAVSALALAIVAARLRERPETAALALLPLFVLLSFRFADEADGRRRWRLGAALVGLQVLLAQIHPYFVFTGPVFAIAAVPALLRVPGRRKSIVGVGALLALGLLSSAEGPHIFTTLRTNAVSDITLYVVEAQDVSWDMFNPGTHFTEPLYLAMAALALLGVVVARRVDIRLAGLAALGLLSLGAAMRGLIPAAVFTAPLAAWSLGQIVGVMRRRRAAAALAVSLAVAGALLVVTVQRMDRLRGPLGTLGLAAGEFPEAAAAYLRTQPEGVRVFTTYTAGPALWFLSGGHVRTYVDGRTPLVFDAVDFALARAARDYKQGFDAAVERFGFEAAVVERSARVCRRLADDPAWAHAASDPRFATFLPRDKVAQPLGFVAPCGAAAVEPRACEHVEDADAEISRIEEASPHYGRFLRVMLRWRCVAAERVPDLIGFVPDPSAAQAFRRERDLLLAEMHLTFGALDPALELLAPLVARGDADAVRLLVAAGQRADAAGRVHPQLMQAYAVLGDGAPPMLSVALAWSCRARGDAGCARYHAMRASVMGAAGAEPVLAWLATAAQDERERADVTRWLQIFASAATRPAGLN